MFFVPNQGSLPSAEEDGKIKPEQDESNLNQDDLSHLSSIEPFDDTLLINPKIQCNNY